MEPARRWSGSRGGRRWIYWKGERGRGVEEREEFGERKRGGGDLRFEG